jgi:Ca2+/H+ antiporter
MVSIAVAVVAAALAYRAGMPYGSLLAVLFAAQNLAVLRQPVAA